MGRKRGTWFGAAAVACGMLGALAVAWPALGISILFVVSGLVGYWWISRGTGQRGVARSRGRVAFNSHKTRDEAGSSVKSFSDAYDEDPF